MSRSYQRVLTILGILWAVWLVLDILTYEDVHILPEWREWEIRFMFTGVMLFTTWFSETALWNERIEPTWPERWLLDVVVIVSVCATFFVSDLIAGNTVNVPLTLSRIVTTSIVVGSSIMTRRMSKRVRIRRRGIKETEARIAESRAKLDKMRNKYRDN
jgi:hypothetical protein